MIPNFDNMWLFVSDSFFGFILGYPEFMPFGEFRRRFEILLPRSERQHEPVLDEKQVLTYVVTAGLKKTGFIPGK